MQAHAVHSASKTDDESRRLFSYRTSFGSRFAADPLSIRSYRQLLTATFRFGPSSPCGVPARVPIHRASVVLFICSLLSVVPSCANQVTTSYQVGLQARPERDALMDT